MNYPGIPASSGPVLAEQMAEHAKKFGAEIRREQVKRVELTGDTKKVFTRRHEYEAKAVIIATGTTARVLGIPGERELTGMGVATAQLVMRNSFRIRRLWWLAAAIKVSEEGMYITKFARKVIVVVLHEEGVLDCNKQSAEKALHHPKMEFIWNSVLAGIDGESAVTGVKVRNVKTNEITELSCNGVFFFVGTVPVDRAVPEPGGIGYAWLDSNHG